MRPDRCQATGGLGGTSCSTSRRCALQHGLTLDQVSFEGDLSGSVCLVKRPEGAKLLQGLKSGDVVISPRLDRCFRSALEALSVLNKLNNRKFSAPSRYG